MPVLFIYLLKLSISLTVVYLFYRFVLRRLTFYNWNRWYLLGYTLLCFFIPFINISAVLEKNDWGSSGIIEWVPVIETSSPAQTFGPVVKTGSGSIDLWQVVTGVMMAGIILMIARLIMQLFSFRRMARKATLISGNGAQIFQVDEQIIPFSFGNAIFINRHLHSEAELQEIILHEFVHVKQKHTIDIIWAEFLCLFSWYNPFAWLLKAAIRQNLEFIADNKVLGNGVDKKQYQFLMLKVIGNNQFSIASPFNFSSLKKRIAMMNKLKSARLNLVRFLFVLPFMAVMLLAFRAKKIPAASHSNYWLTGLVIDANSEMPLKGVEIREEISGLSIVTDEHGYFKMYIKVKDPSAKLSASFSLAGYERSARRLNSTNPGIEFVYLHRLGEKGQVGSTLAYPGEPQYLIVVEKLRELQQQRKLEKKIDELVGNSTHPIWIVDGVPYAVLNDGKGAKGYAWFDENDLKDSHEFRVFVDGKVMTMEETNNTISRFDLDGVGAVSRSQALSDYGVNYNLLILKTNHTKTVRPVVDTMPPKVMNADKLKSISTEYEITDKQAWLKLKNGSIEKYDLTNLKEHSAFEKKYGKIINVNTNVNTNIKANINSNISTTVRSVIAPVSVKPDVIITTSPKISGVITPVAIISNVFGETTVAPAMASAAGNVTVMDDYGNTITGNEAIVITITKNTTPQELEKFKTQMKEKGIDLSFDEIEYNEKGLLVSINGTMKSGDSRSNFVATDFNKLILAMIKDGDRTYFKVSVRDNKEVI